MDTQTTNKELKIVDFPTIIAGIYHAVHALLPHEENAITPDYDSIMKREINRFIDTLRFYIREDPCKSIDIKIEKEDTFVVDVPQKKGNFKFWWFLKS